MYSVSVRVFLKKGLQRKMKTHNCLLKKTVWATLAFQALVSNSPHVLQPRVMTVSDFREIAKVANDPSPQEITEQRCQDAAQRAEKSVNLSVSAIHKMLREKGIDWSCVILEEVYVLDRGSPKNRKKYRPEECSEKQRLDVFLRMSVDGWIIVVKLDDCFLVQGKRSLGDGLKLMGVQKPKPE